MLNWENMSTKRPPLSKEHDPGFEAGIWLDPSQRPREYTQLDWVNADSLLNPLLELAQPTEHDVLVDVGTGTGAVLNYFSPHIKTGIGIDISSSMLSQIDSADHKLLVMNADARDMPFADETVDIVTTRMMLHDLKQPGEVIAEMWRIIKPGGRLVASEYVVDLADPEAIEQTDDFEEGSVDSAIIDGKYFRAPSAAVLGLHRALFALKHEPERHLWTGEEFKELFISGCEGAESVENHFSVTPYNSVANWLGKSGFEAEVKQEGLIACLECPDEVKQELSMIITLGGEPISAEAQADLLARYRSAGSADREVFELDAKIHRVFANIVVTK